MENLFGYELTDADKKIMDYMMAKALLAAQVRKGLLAQEAFERIEEKIELHIEHINAK